MFNLFRKNSPKRYVTPVVDHYKVGADVVLTYTEMAELELIRAYTNTLIRFGDLGTMADDIRDGEIEGTEEQAAHLDEQAKGLNPYIQTIESIMESRGVCIATVIGYVREMDGMNGDDVEYITSEFLKSKAFTPKG